MELFHILKHGIEAVLFLWVLQIERRLARIEGKMDEVIMQLHNGRRKNG